MNQKITSITAQKRPGRFNVFLDGNYAFSVSEEVLVKFQLLKGKELDSANLEKIFKADDLSKALNKALDYLSYSLRTEKETRQKLAKEGLEDDIIETVVKKLTKMKLLNDSEYAKSYVRTMAKTTDKGPRFIANSLKEKGISPYDTEDALLEYPAEMQLKNALKLAEKTIAKSKKKSFNERNQKITQALLNKGYSSELAQVRQSLNLTKDVNQEHENLRLETEKLWHKNSRIDLKKRRNKIKAALFRKGFDLYECDRILDELENTETEN